MANEMISRQLYERGNLKVKGQNLYEIKLQNNLAKVSLTTINSIKVNNKELIMNSVTFLSDGTNYLASSIDKNNPLLWELFERITIVFEYKQDHINELQLEFNFSTKEFGDFEFALSDFIIDKHEKEAK
jgi:hypothetical protein